MCRCLEASSKSDPVRPPPTQVKGLNVLGRKGPTVQSHDPPGSKCWGGVLDNSSGAEASVLQLLRELIHQSLISTPSWQPPEPQNAR